MMQNTSALHPLPLLDRVRDGLRRGRATRAMSELFEGLQELRSSSSADEWRSIARRASEHDVCELIHEDPMTRRSFEKPRGYAGDAVLLDYIYRQREPEQASDTGRSVYRYAVGRPAACAVRHRRDWLGYQIDRVADRLEGRARVLSVACGHLREGQLSAALQDGSIAEFVALDSDAESLAVVGSAGNPAITPVELSVGRLLGRWNKLGRFDMVYSAGLYDYLEPALARRLTHTLFKLLEPGGKLIFTNFLPTVADAGYMETYMGWELIYRDLPELGKLTSEIPAGEIGDVRLYSDPYEAIGYAEVIRGTPGPTD